MNKISQSTMLIDITLINKKCNLINLKWDGEENEYSIILKD